MYISYQHVHALHIVDLPSPPGFYSWPEIFTTMGIWWTASNSSILNGNSMQCIEFPHTRREFDVVHRIPVESIVNSTRIRWSASYSRWKRGFIHYEFPFLSVMSLPKLAAFWAILGFKVPTVMIYFRGWVKLITKYILHFHSEPRQKVEKFMLKIRSPTKSAFDTFIPNKSYRTLLRYQAQLV